MFVRSQLEEISQQFHADVQDLQTFLAEEGLPVDSPVALPDLSARLNADSRFRRDVSSLLHAVLYRDPEELGSMDLLGILVVAAAGTRQDFRTAPQQEAMRDLLRFVMQQRRPAARPVPAPSIEITQHRPITPAPVVIQSPLPEPVLAEPVPTRKTFPDPPFTRSVFTTPSVSDEEERKPFWRPIYAFWILGLFAILLGFGAGEFLHRNPAEPRIAPQARIAPQPQPATHPQPALAAPEPSAETQSAFQPVRRPAKASRRVSRHAAHAFAPAANTPSPASLASANQPPTIAPAKPQQPENPPAQTANLKPMQPVADNRNAPLKLPPVNPPRQASAPASRPAGNPFAHPDIDTSALDAPPTQSTHRKDPVLIARNAPPVAGSKPTREGTVHLGSAGAMAGNLMYSPAPQYPAGAIEAGVQGEVRVQAIVGPRGDVVDAHVVSGPPLLRDAALEAVQRWRYRPYEQEGKPLSVATTAILDFQIPQKN